MCINRTFYNTKLINSDDLVKQIPCIIIPDFSGDFLDCTHTQHPAKNPPPWRITKIIVKLHVYVHVQYVKYTANPGIDAELHNYSCKLIMPVCTPAVHVPPANPLHTASVLPLIVGHHFKACAAAITY